MCLAACLAGGCGSQTAPESAPATLPEAALPDLAARERVLDRDALAADAFDTESLGSTLAGSGYTTGREREFSGKTSTFDHVVARSLVFEDGSGADEYLDWLRRHPEEILGQSAPASIVTPGDGGFALRLVPCGSCKKELPTYFAAWRRDATAGTLLASGSGANPDRFRALLAKSDAALRAS